MVEKKKRKSNVEGGKKLLKFLKNEREDLSLIYTNNLLIFILSF